MTLANEYYLHANASADQQTEENNMGSLIGKGKYKSSRVVDLVMKSESNMGDTMKRVNDSGEVNSTKKNMIVKQIEKLTETDPKNKEKQSKQDSLHQKSMDKTLTGNERTYESRKNFSEDKKGQIASTILNS